MPRSTPQPNEQRFCYDCNYTLNGLPTLPSGVVQCPECGWKGIPRKVIVKPLRPKRWALLGAAIGFAPLLLIPLDALRRTLGATGLNNLTVSLLVYAPLLAIGPLLIAASFAAASAQGRGTRTSASLAALVFTTGVLACGITWALALVYLAVSSSP